MEKYFVQIGNGTEVVKTFEEVLEKLLDAIKKKQVITIGLATQSTDTH